MCFDICTINIRVSIRVRGLHLVYPHATRVVPWKHPPCIVVLNSRHSHYLPDIDTADWLPEGLFSPKHLLEHVRTKMVWLHPPTFSKGLDYHSHCGLQSPALKLSCCGSALVFCIEQHLVTWGAACSASGMAFLGKGWNDETEMSQFQGFVSKHGRIDMKKAWSSHNLWFAPCILYIPVAVPVAPQARGCFLSFPHFYQNDSWGRNRNHSSTTKKIEEGECSIPNLWLYSMFYPAVAIPVAVRIAPRSLLSKSQGNRKRKNTLLARGFDPLKNHMSHWVIEDHHPKVWINKGTWNHQQDEKWWK